MNIPLGQKIRSFRKAAGMSQQELEITIETSFGTISRIEGGKTNPTKETVLKISKALNLQPVQSISLFEVEPKGITTLLEIATRINNSSSLDEVLQKSVNEISFGLNLLGSAIFIRENDIVYEMVMTQTWYSDLTLKIAGTSLRDVSCSINTKNMINDSIKDSHIHEGEQLLELLIGFLPQTIINKVQQLVNAKSVLAIPLIKDNNPIGAIVFGKAQSGGFSMEKEILTAFASFISSAICNYNV